MANRNWRSGGYQSFNQILTPMSYYPQPVTYQADRRAYGGRGGYRDDSSKHERKDFQSNRRERISPIKRRSPYQRPHETNTNFRKDSKKSYGHYEVKVPRLTFDIKELSTSSLNFRYPKMYIPSDFFHTRLNVQEAFPLYRPMELGNHCDFQMINKEVDLNEILDVVSEPVDVNYKYSAKVMLMTTPDLPELYKLACHMPFDGAAKGQTKYGLYKNVQFLVGSKGKNEPMAIGGAWSPSLDGDNPEEDPNVLVRTAIRTCKSLTGIDLSRCKKWYKCLDIHYYRPSDRKTHSVNESDKKEETTVDHELEPSVEIVTIFIPDILSCIPSSNEWSEIRDIYDKKLQSLLFPKVVQEVLLEETKKEEPIEESNEKIDEKIVEEKVEEEKEMIDEVKEKVEEAAATDMDLNQMKVTELRSELISRGLDGKGLKLVLIQRLQEAIDNEKAAAEAKVAAETKKNESIAENHVTHSDIVGDSDKINEPTNVVVTSSLPEKEQKRLKWLYKVNDKPSIMVYPTKNSKGEHNEFSLMTLEKLLEYRLEDQKEHVFEVSLFAEQFHEMIQRDAAFVIYKALTDLPEVVVKETTAVTEPEIKKARIDTDIRKSKMIVDIDLLFAFFVFDSENCGYLRDHDLENILHCIGLNLSRSQAKRLLSRIPAKKGNVVYRDVVERDVIEGSHEDVASLRTGEPNVERLIELSMGNKSFFDEVDNHSLGSRDGSLSLLDKLTRTEATVARYRVQLSLLQDELNKIKTVEDTAADVANHLRDNIKKIADKLAIENDSMAKLSGVTAVYSGLLKMASDHMGESINEINGQFDHEKLLADKAKEEADRIRSEADKAAKEEADRIKAAKEEADRIRAAKEEADKAVADGVELVTDGAVVDDTQMEGSNI